MQRNVVKRTLVSARSSRFCVALAMTGALLAFASSAVAAPSSTPDGTYVTNGEVDAFARSGNTVYLGGEFTQIGPRTGPLVSLSAASGVADLALPQVTGGEGYIEAIVSDGHGGEYIGGSFTHVGGLARSNAAHILANDTVDPNWNPDLNASVDTLALSGNVVYLGGEFTTVNGTLTRNRAAAVDATTGVATSWNPDANGEVKSIAVSGTTVYLGGYFSGTDAIGSATRNYIAAVDASTGAINNTWNPGAESDVRVIVVSGGTVYVGGDFTGNGSIGGANRGYLASLDATSGTVSGWNPDANQPVVAIAVSGSTVYVGGEFHGANSIGGQQRNYIAAINASGAATSWNPGSNGDVAALAVSGGTVYAAGDFNGASSIGGQPRNYIAAIDATTGLATSWNPNANADVYALALSGSNVVAGGYLSSVGGVARDNVAAINAADGTPTAWNPDADDEVNAIAVSGNTVYLGGDFGGSDSIGTATRNFAAAVDATTGAVESWNPSPNAEVDAIAVSGNTVYLGGEFNGATAINGSVTRNYAAAVDGTSGVATAWNPDANSDVSAVVVSGSTVYLGGLFEGTHSMNGSVTRNYVAAVDATTGTATAWNPDANGHVGAIALIGNTVYLGGDFSGAGSIGGANRNYAAAVDATSGVATAWNPNTSGYVNGLAVSGSTVYLSGYFYGSDAINGTVTRDGLAAVDATTGTVTAWDPVTNYEGAAVYASPDGTVYAGGGFTTFDLAAQTGFASFSEAPANSALPQVTGVPDPGQTLACSTGTWTGSTPQNYAYQWLRNGTAIAGATGSTYVLAPTDAGQLFSCAVTASNLGATQASATSATVVAESAFAGKVKVNKTTGAITFTETVSDPGVLHWVLTFQNGKFGVFAAKKHKKAKCKKGKIKLSGKCRAATVVYAQGSVTVAAAGTKTFTVKPNADGKKAFKRALSHHKTLTLTATLSFQSNHGGSPVIHKQTISFKPVKPSKHKHKKHKTRK